MITYVDAVDGALNFYSKEKNKSWTVRTVEQGVMLLGTQTYDSHMGYGSDMDFATEAGFENDDDAKKMLMAIIDIVEPLCEEIG